MPVGKFHTMPEAAEILGVSRPRVSQLCMELGIGERIGGVGARLLAPMDMRKLKIRHSKRLNAKKS